MRGVRLLLPLLGAGCLPQDTRPPPAQITFTASSSELTRSGIASSLTADGFAIEFERVLVDLGRADVGDGEDTGSCNEYSSPGYTRLFDFTQVSAPQELGIAFATGRCPFSYVVRFPNLDAKLGVGASEDDRTFMRTPGNDPVARDEGVSLFVVGSATRGDEFKQFHWAFRQRIRSDNCLVAQTPDQSGRLELASGERTSVNIEIHAEALFQGRTVPMPHFEPFAQADSDGDGEITLAELFATPLQAAADAGLFNPKPVLPDIPGAHEPVPCFDSDGEAIELDSLGAFTYCELAPMIPQLPGTGGCEVSMGFPDRRPE